MVLNYYFYIVLNYYHYIVLNICSLSSNTSSSFCSECNRVDIFPVIVAVLIRWCRGEIELALKGERERDRHMCISFSIHQE